MITHMLIGVMSMDPFILQIKSYVERCTNYADRLNLRSVVGLDVCYVVHALASHVILCFGPLLVALRLMRTCASQ